MSSKSVLLVGNYFHSETYNKNVWHFLAEYLSKAGWMVITTSTKIPKLERLVDMLTTIWKTKHQYHLAQVDVFSGDAFFWAEACTYLLTLIKKPIVLTLHGGGLPEFGMQHPKRLKRVLNLGKVVVTPSPFMQNELKQYRSDIRLIENPIDLAASIYRHRETPTPKLIWARSFHEIYNPCMVPRVIKLLEEEFPGVSVLMIGPDKGDGSLHQMLELADKLGVRERIEVTGGIPHTEIPGYLNLGDIFLNTSNYDTAPRSLLEAMANGLCVVSTNVGGIPFIAENGKDALLVPPRDAGLMAQAIRKILVEQDLAGSLSRNARKRTEKSDWSVIVPKWESIFNEVIKLSDENPR